MKRTTLFLLTFLAMAFLCASCGKNKNTWERFYGYTKAEILGNYEANPDSELYEELPTEGVVVYPEVELSITEYDEDLVNVRIRIPDQFYRNFRGMVALNEDDSEISIGGDDRSDILMTVYKNAQNQIRLHGRVRTPSHWDQNGPDDYNIYGFDVLKIENNEN
jgi:hypothetical protein